jgi:hypothetical protein
MSTQPPSSGSTREPSARRALGFTAGFIRDRTRAIRKEFSLQSSWGHEEAINCLERIARYHILSLRELQEESGNNTDMHIDNAELGRCERLEVPPSPPQDARLMDRLHLVAAALR